MRLERHADGYLVEATLLAQLLDVPAEEVPLLLRRSEITSICERGEGEHEGQHRLTFFYKTRRARLNIDQAGELVGQTVVDLPEPVRPAARP